jgi:hypothetical protein
VWFTIWIALNTTRYAFDAYLSRLMTSIFYRGGVQPHPLE